MHANALACGTQVVGPSCTTIEYGNPFDVMGVGLLNHFNAYAKEILGYFAPSNILELQTTGTNTYVLNPLEQLSSGLQMVKILKEVDSSGKRTWYNVESRKPIGYDSVLSTRPDVSNGALVTLAADGDLNSKLLHMNPGLGSFNYAALPLGQTFTDPTGITMTPTASTSANLMVRITIPADTTPPTVMITAPTAGQTIAGTITVSAWTSDNVGAVGVRFRLDGADLGAEDTTPPYDLSWDTRTTTNGSHTLIAMARDAAGNIGTSPALTVMVIVTVPLPTLTLSANPTTILAGQASTLTWSSTNATSCTASGGWSGTRATSGTEVVTPTLMTSYLLTCQGSGGSILKFVTVLVTASTP